jgi:hypothetical protein
MRLPYGAGMRKSPKQWRDPNQLAKLIVDILTGQTEMPKKRPDGKNSATVRLGKLGAMKDDSSS